jgi:hypothetical protein
LSTAHRFHPPLPINKVLGRQLFHFHSMAQNPFDQLAKQYLEEFLAPFGEVIRNLEVPGEAKFVDVFFAPTPPATIPKDLGLLARMLETTCCLEPFRNPPSRTEIRTCLLKLFWLQEDQRRKAKTDNRKIPEEQLTQLWILATSVSQPVLTGYESWVKVKPKSKPLTRFWPSRRSTLDAIIFCGC